MESDEKASVVEIQGRVGVEADVASGVAVVSVVEVACREDGTTGVSVVTTEGALMVEVSVVTTEGALMVDAEVEEKAKERTVLAPCAVQIGIRMWQPMANGTLNGIPLCTTWGALCCK